MRRPHPPRRTPTCAFVAAAALSMPVLGHAQHAPADTSGRSLHAMIGAQAVGSATQLTNAIDGRTMREAYVSQPAIMAHASFGSHVALTSTINLEGLTMQRGELLGGVYGEGYVDRRHPHTLVHEAIAAVQARVIGVVHGSLAAGKGFVPFGTDDPMMRPFERYPINHHLSQILERAVAVAAVRVPHALLEAGAFGGDEPVGPYEAPKWARFGDSWAMRATVMPLTSSLELSGSIAHVRSPESRDLGGLDQHKRNVSARWAAGAPLGGADPSRATGSYALAEWAMTDSYRNGRRVTVVGYREVSLLAEGGVRRRGIELVARAEQTDRPEEERLVDPFRSPRPAPDVSTLGLTRWRTLTLGVSRPIALGALRVGPFVEGTRLSPRARVANSLFEPTTFYGGHTLYALTAGLRLGLGMRHERMGHYGVASTTHATHADDMPMMDMSHD